MEVLTRGGLAKPMRSTTTGEAQSLGFRSVPAASSATAQTPSTTATVMRTTSSGECPGVQSPWVCVSGGLIKGKSGKVLTWEDNRGEMWGANSVDNCQEYPGNTKAEWGQRDKGAHWEAGWHIMDVFIFHSERKIMSHVGSTDLHYSMCPARMEGRMQGADTWEKKKESRQMSAEGFQLPGCLL